MSLCYGFLLMAGAGSTSYQTWAEMQISTDPQDSLSRWIDHRVTGGGETSPHENVFWHIKLCQNVGAEELCLRASIKSPMGDGLLCICFQLNVFIFFASHSPAQHNQLELSL